MRVDIELHDDIKRRLRKRGVTFVKIARELGVSGVSITKVCQGHIRSERIQRAIARRLEVEPNELWPDRYVKEEEALMNR